MLQGSDVPCKVIPIKVEIVRRRVGAPPVEPGQMLYYLWHEPTGLFYIECYVSQAFAIKKAMVLAPPSSMGDVAESWRADYRQCTHSYKTQEQA